MDSLTKLGRLALRLMVLLVVALLPAHAHAFCGFYVGKASTALYNHASKVVLVRHEGRSVISIMSDYDGTLADFAMVVPVPVVLQRGQIHIGNAEVFRHLDDYSTPRLVEYDDPNPCPVFRQFEGASGAPEMPGGRAQLMQAQKPAKALGVKVEASYTIGEYDIVILSAKQSNGLETWLTESGYQIPHGASGALAPYIRSGMKFFVAKVNLKEQAKTGLSYLRPIQFAFESPKFMLPIRLGMINAHGPQDLIVYLLTADGRGEATNYRTVEMPTGVEVPRYVRDDFPRVYAAIFSHQAKLNDLRAVFTEYVWNMGWCDPCAAPPLSAGELRELGVFWLGDQNPAPGGGGARAPMFRYMPVPSGGPTQVILTRLHVRYSADTFPEDLMFQETGDTGNFQVRYVLHRPWNGSPELCPAAATYFQQVDERRVKEAQNLADLTGWEVGKIMSRIGLNPSMRPRPWWQGLWE